MKILCVKYSRAVGLRIEALGGLRSKSWREQTPFFSKIIGVCFLQLFDPRHGLVSNCNLSCTTISRVIFSWFWPHKIKTYEKNYMVITLLGFLTILAFEILIKLTICIKRSILKRLSKDSISFTHSATLEIWQHLIHKMTKL